MSGYYILDHNDNPVPTDLDTWVRSQQGSSTVRKDERGGVLVSTVFLGLDHSHGNGPPALWETMIFGGPHDQYQERYTSKADAFAGHARSVAQAFPDTPDTT